MRIITVNCCGIRSAASKGLFKWLAKQKADFICLQETKAHFHQLAEHDIDIPGYKAFFHDAERKGYAGVAIYTRHEPTRIVKGFGVPEFDGEGRYLEAQLGDLSVVSLYAPSGSAGPERQASKFRFLEAFAPVSRSGSGAASGTTSSAATGTSRTRTSTCGTGSRTRRTPASCPRSARGSISSSITRATSMRSAK